MLVRELKGWPYSSILADGSTFRLLPHEAKIVNEYLVSSDMRTAQSMKLISITKESPKSESAVENTMQMHNKGRKKKQEESNDG